jgi:4-coumarate--CoA ligase
MIVLLTNQISPSEIANTLEKINGVHSVFVTGIPDIDKGDLPVALVVKVQGSTLTEMEILDQYNTQAADYKRLRGGVYFVDELPMTVSGKIVIKQAKEMAVKLYDEQNGKIRIVSNSNNDLIK